jgi:hypothetical protein
MLGKPKKEQEMKTFEVEYRRTSYITITVEARDKNEAEDIAWDEVNIRADIRDAEWEVESIEEAPDA